ncbi:MAG: tetratricopeptide repeat protein, partial [Planctomycetes bacterium]|nr:tetratricopeptide repeat protein [Planctomycetota bacterium]
LHRLYTAEQLARMLDVPVARIRSWMRQGLLEPARIARRLVWFDFRQVANVRVLFELTERGVGPARIRKSLEELRSALGREQVGYGWLDALEARGPLLFRREDGTLCEPNGQLHLDFRVTEGRRTQPGPVEIAELAKRTNTPEDSADDWFEVGVRAEDEGRLTDAMQAYLNALLAGGPQAETCFNLANVLLALDREGEAMQRYLQAIEIDPDYIEAWNNLGNVFSIQGRLEDAASAFSQALQIEPDYADAHCNLGDTLDRLARHDEAREHWERYLELDPDSTWAVRVRERLDTGKL